MKKKIPDITDLGTISVLNKKISGAENKIPDVVDLVNQTDYDAKISGIKQKYFFGDDGFQNMFVYQPKLDILELKKDKGTNYVLSWKSKGLYNIKLV